MLRQMPWNVLWLVGGGLALSLAFKESKLSRLIATAFAGVDSVPFPLVVLSVVVVRSRAIPQCTRPVSPHIHTYMPSHIRWSSSSPTSSPTSRVPTSFSPRSAASPSTSGGTCVISCVYRPQ